MHFISPAKQIHNNDDFYVTDAIQKNIVKYDSQGNYLGTIGTELIPLSVAINNRDQLYVGDQATGTIYTIDANGSKTSVSFKRAKRERIITN